MKCVFVTNVDVNPASMPASEKSKIRFRFAPVGSDPTPKPIPYFPANTEFEHPEAYKHCRTGTASPGDEECRVAANMTPEQLQAAQRLHRIAAAGILDSDIELFDLEVITGYEMNGEYKKGPNFDTYMTARKEHEAKQTTGTDI